MKSFEGQRDVGKLVQSLSDGTYGANQSKHTKRGTFRENKAILNKIERNKMNKANKKKTKKNAAESSKITDNNEVIWAKHNQMDRDISKQSETKKCGTKLSRSTTERHRAKPSNLRGNETNIANKVKLNIT